MLVLFAGLVAFVIWGAAIVRGSKKTPPPPPPGDPSRALELITDLAPKLRSDDDAGSTCVGALRMIERQARAEALVHCLRSDDPAVAEAALYCAGDFVTDDERIAPLLLAAGEGEPNEVSTYALARSGLPEALTRIKAILNESGPSRYQAIWALAIWDGPEATNTLLDFVVTEPDPVAGMMAAEALGYRRDTGAYRALVNLLETVQPVAESSMIGERAALALGYIGQKSAVKHLRDASHRVGDYNTTERLTMAFALCRLRPDDDYNFWVLQRSLKGKLPDAPYRPSGLDEFVTAVRLLIQLDQPRVKQVLIDASQGVEADRAQAIIAGFAAMGLEPTWDEASRSHVLKEMPEGRAPKQKAWVLTPPWPFGDAR